MPDETPSRVPKVIRWLNLPPGNLPRNTQALVLGAIALLMALIIAFSNSSAPPEKRRVPTPAAEPVTDPNESRIREYRARIEEQARKLAEEQAKLVAPRETLPPRHDVRDYAPAPPERYIASSTYPPIDRTPPAYAAEVRSPRSKEESLLATNIAYSSREPDSHRSPGSTPKLQPGESGLLQLLAQLSHRSPQEVPAAPSSTPPKRAADKNDMQPVKPESTVETGPRYRVFEGTIIETSLVNRLDGEFSGPVNCQVSADVYSHNKRHLLIPAGTRVLGEARRVETFGQTRLAVAFHRLIMPDGYAVDLDNFKGLNQIGETGLKDQVNNHYLKMFSASLAIGMLAGFSQANTRSGFDASGADVYGQGVASSLSHSSLRILDRFLNVLPTITIREGHRVKVYLSGDLELPDYDHHQLPSGV